MRVTAVIAIAALSVSSVSAAAAPEANPLWKSADPLRLWKSADPWNRFSFCGAPGQACGKVRRGLDAVATIVSEANEHNVSPAKRDAWRNRFSFCGAPGQACGKMRRNVEDIGDALDDVYKREAKWSPPGFSFCGIRGQACGKAKRDASPEAEAEADARWSPPGFSFCGIRGQACGKNKRDALPEAEAEPNALWKSADPLRLWKSADPWNRFSFCGAPGQACGKAKRAADAINEFDPEIFKQVCFEEGNECDIVMRAKKALDQVKRDAAAAAEPQPWKNRFSFCGAPGQACGRDVHEFIKAADDDEEVAKRAATECHGADGPCTLAEADFAHLEKAVNSAFEALGDL